MGAGSLACGRVWSKSCRNPGSWASLEGTLVVGAGEDAWSAGGPFLSLVRRWPLLRQVTSGDRLALGRASTSARTEQLRPRTSTADRVVKSICPYCAVGCGQNVYVRDEQVVQIEGDPDSPISRGRLCPKGVRDAAAHHRLRPSDQGALPARRTPPTGRSSISPAGDGHGRRPGHRHPARHLGVGAGRPAVTARTMGIASLGGATLDNEENYLIKKLLTALGVVQVENQARVCHSSTVVGSRHLVRPRRRHHLHAGPAALRLHRHRRAPTSPRRIRSASSG